ncbi:MAG: hypothetical protein JSS45_12700, partial [Proteobacteria bacterium]|nr:hypothetical protein [Pseudomonadota bacterium]
KQDLTLEPWSLLPEDVIRRRFAAGLDHFHERYKQAVDDWALFDNTGEEPAMLEWGENT